MRLLLAKLLGSVLRGEDQTQVDAKEGIAILESQGDRLSDLPPEVRADWLAVLAQLQVAAGDPAGAMETVDAAPAEWLPNEVRLIITAEAHKSAGRRDEAVAAANAALAALGVGSDPITVRQLALLFEELEEFKPATILWERTSAFRSIGIDERHLLNCAQRAEEFELIIKVCQRFRGSGRLDRNLILLEVWALERVSDERLVSAIGDLLTLPIDESLKKELRAQRSYTAGRLDRPELVENNEALLPSFGEVKSATDGRVVVEVLRRGSTIRRAIEYAYQLFRRFPNDVDAHLAVILSSGLPDPVPIPFSDPVAAMTGTAVRYCVEGSEEEVWYIIEDFVTPQPLLSEHSPEEPIARALRGLTTDETFSLRGPPHPVTAKIVEIVDKHVYRIRDCIDGFEERFPKHPHFLKKIHVGDDPKAALELLLKQVEQTTKARERIEEAYSTHPATLFVLAEALGTSIFEAYFYVADKASMSFRCCQGSDREKRSFREAARKATGLVLDVPALAAIYLLNLRGVIPYSDLFEAWDKEFIVSEHALSDVRDALQSLSPHGGMQIAKQGEQFVRHETTEADARKRHERLREFLEAVRARCRLVTAEQPRAEDAKWYGELSSVLGPSGAESARITKTESGLSLWAEEYYAGELAKPILGERRLWVQPLVERLVEQRRLKPEFAVKVRIAVFLAGYTFIGVSADMLFHTASHNGWRIDGPMQAMMRQYSERNVTSGSAVRTSSEFLSRAWRANARRRKIDVAKTISKRLLTEMRKRSDGAVMVWHVWRLVNEELQSIDRELARQWRRTVKKLL